MNESRLDVQTRKSVQECASTFRQSVQDSYGGGRKLLRGISAMRGMDMGGVEFFEPQDSVFSSLEEQPAWKAGAFIPGHSKMHGPTKMAVHIYVTDLGNSRRVQLVGPYSMGERGSTERLLQKIAANF